MSENDYGQTLGTKQEQLFRTSASSLIRVKIALLHLRPVFVS